MGQTAFPLKLCRPFDKKKIASCVVTESETHFTIDSHSRFVKERNGYQIQAGEDASTVMRVAVLAESRVFLDDEISYGLAARDRGLLAQLVQVYGQAVC